MAKAGARRVLRQIIDAADAIGPQRFGEHIVADARLRDLVGADGVYVRFGAASHASGLVPDLPGLPALLARLPRERSVGRAWSTHRLVAELGELGHLAGDCAGLLLVPLSSGGDVLAWFRGEVSRTVRWAADPARPVVTGSQGQRLTPRGSSSVWQETVRGQSRPWSGEERGIAEEAYRALLDVAGNEPLRGIAGYAARINEDSATLDDVAVKRLDTIGWLASRMDELLDSLSEYSRLSRADREDITSVSLDAVVDDIEEILGPRFADAACARVLDRPLRPPRRPFQRHQRPG